MSHQNISIVLLLLLMIGVVSSSPLNKISEGISNIAYNLLYLPMGIFKYVLDSIKFNRMELANANVKDGDEYDFIIVGAGSAGSVLANRLTEENVTVLLIEAGGKEYKFFDIPSITLVLEILGINWDFRTEPSNEYCKGIRGNSCRWGRGKVMGGTSTINAMIAVRGNPKGDYDKWAAWGNEGWAYKDVLPYFKKLEHNEAIGAPGYDPTVRGTKGPITISYSWSSKVARSFVKAGQQIGYPVLDYNGRSQIGFSITQANIENGERVSSNVGYLHSIKPRKNLDVTMHSMVQKVNINPATKKAEGVTFMKNGKQITVKAKKEVILSAGALQSPQLLMLSGVGPAAHLNEHNIKVLKDSPGVGQNLMDHVTYFGHVFLINTTDTQTIPNYFLPWNNALAKYLKKRKGPISSSSLSPAIAYINIDNKSSEISNMEFLYNDLSLTFDDFYVYQSLILGLKQKIFLKMYAKYTNRHAYQIMPILLKPKSRGEIRLRSTDVYDYPKFIPNYYKHPDDVKTMISGLKIALELSQTEALQKFKSKLVPEPVVGCENMTFNTDPYWECALRTLTFSFWHFTGTVKMGPESDPMAVVDSRLRVYGIDALRVIDASIMPEVPSAHTNIPTIMIAERTADLIKQDWGFFQDEEKDSSKTEMNENQREKGNKSSKSVNGGTSEQFMKNIDN